MPFAVRMKKAWVLIYPLSAQRRLWSDWADGQADLSFRWAHTHFVGFVMSQLIYMHVNLMKRSVCKTSHIGKMISTCMSQDFEMAITKLMIFFFFFFFLLGDIMYRNMLGIWIELLL